MAKAGQDLQATAVWLNERGYVVNNCFQIGGRWRVNVRRTDWRQAQGQTHHFVEGATLPEALTELVSKRMASENRLADALASLTAAVRGSDAL